MKKTKIENIKKTRAKRYLFFAGILIAICALMLYNAISKNNYYSSNPFEQVSGEVVTLETVEEESVEYYLITFTDQTEPLKLSTEYNPNLKSLKDNVRLSVGSGSDSSSGIVSAMKLIEFAPTVTFGF